MIKDSEYCSKIIETNKPLVMTEKDHKGFNNSTKCWVCKKAYEEVEVKVKDHINITWNFWGSSHQECNLNLSLTEKIPAVFHNLQN